MNAALTGPAPMSFSGGGGTNRSSRLYQALVETELATSVGGSWSSPATPISMICRPPCAQAARCSEVEDALLAELDRLATDSITEAELDKAIKQSKAQFAYAADESTNQAYWLGWTETDRQLYLVRDLHRPACPRSRSTTCSACAQTTSSPPTAPSAGTCQQTRHRTRWQ